ncbi:MAG: HAD family phosphatase [Nanoarchaeota archaeon]|nr:HAD family phosphatase [Nanoarchaeota archaeon]
MKKLIVFDLDGVIFDHLNFWDKVVKVYKTEKESKALVKKYLHTNYPKLVEEVTKLWIGKPKQPYLEEIKKAKYMPGAKETIKELKKRDYTIAIISSSPKELVLRAKKELNIDYVFYNEMLFDENDKFIGFNQHVGNLGKQKFLKQLCHEHYLDYKDVIVVGHDKNDIKMARVAGFVIGFNPKDKEFEKYCKVIIKKKDLREILKHL